MTTDALVAKGQHKLHLDEKVQWMWERDENKPMFGLYRYQHIQLWRDGQRKHFVSEMGPTIAHPFWTQFNFPALGEYSVGECLEIADGLREGQPPQENDPLDLALSYLNLLEENQNRRVHKSTFGSGGQIVRV
jgi:hypothetical protein|tara:strand:+ start:117 stop:515 length:399 start_codon:yes stop_codon:yes gene_type:complete